MVTLMFSRKLFWLLSFFIPIVLTGCGGGGEVALLAAIHNGGGTATDNPKLSGIAVEQTSLSTASVTWQAATNNSTTAEQMSYEIHVSKSVNFIPDDTTRRITVIGITDADITGLEVGKTYYVLVIAVDKQGTKSGDRGYQTLYMDQNYSLVDVIPTVLPEPVTLPPDPGEQGQLSLEGIDSDKDGVRDDVQRFIALTYTKTEDKPLRAALREYTALQQQFLKNASNSLKSSTTAEYSTIPIQCVSYFRPIDAQDIFLDIEAELFNTELRSLAYVTAESWLGGQIFSLIESDRLPTVCAKFTAVNQQTKGTRSPPKSALTSKTSSCEKIDAVIVYANGMNNTESVSMTSLVALRSVLEPLKDSNDTFKHQVWSFQLSYNVHENQITEFKELIRQKNTDTRIGPRMKKLQKDSAFADAELPNTIAREIKKEYQQDKDLATHIAHYKQWIKEGSNVVVVAHSQGNFYTNFAYLALTKTEKASFGIVAVATPASFVADGKNLYTTLHTDDVVKGWVANLSHVFGREIPLQTNIGNSSYSNSNRDNRGHNFIDAYLNGDQSRQQILDDVLTSLNGLKTPESTDSGGVINAIQGGDTPEQHKIDLGSTKGTFQFDYDTYSIKDKIEILYEGQKIFDTGCVGKSESQSLKYEGTTSKIDVIVSPNCSGQSGTQWNFAVHCPKKSP